jgi:hypothetical protein
LSPTKFDWSIAGLVRDSHQRAPEEDSPMMNAPMIDPMIAFGASTPDFVSWRVPAVSKP